MGVIATSTLAGSEDAVVVETALVVRVFASLLARSALVIIPMQCSACMSRCVLLFSNWR